MDLTYNMSKEVKLIYLTFLCALVFIVLHNFLFFLLGKEEGVFFIAAFLALLAFVFSIVYSLVEYVTKKKPDDLWKAGFLGFLGFLGFVPQLNQIFFGFFCFLLLFFLVKKNYNFLRSFVLFIVLVSSVSSLSFLFYKSVQNNQDNVSFFLNSMKETLKGIEFSDLESVSFSWPESTEPLSGKGFKNMTITNSQYKELKDFFENNGFSASFFDIESVTNAGVSGYKRNNLWCVLRAGFYYDDNGEPVPEDRLKSEIYCANK
ncbi:MAG TPA: hypothetical protein PLV95_01935 [Candidatus Pacearchaeota archaeon]|nr:hypothetical protein [Candidatus Pacearchaeota archaeon]